MEERVVAPGSQHPAASLSGMMFVGRVTSVCPGMVEHASLCYKGCIHSSTFELCRNPSPQVQRQSPG